MSYSVILEDDFDDVFEKTPDEIIDIFVSSLSDNDLIDIMLYVEDTPGHYWHKPQYIKFYEKI